MSGTTSSGRRETRSVGSNGSSGPEKGFDWRGVVARGLYHAGAARFMRGVSRTYDAEFVEGAKWPRWRRSTAPKYLILCYHRIGAGGIPLYSELSPATFEAQMRHLRKNYRVISLEQLCRELREPSGGHGVAVTFDDGYRDLYNHAFPILKKYHIPATVFLIANSVESGQVAWYDRVFLSLQVFPAEFLDIELDRPRHFKFLSAGDRFRVALELVTILRTLSDFRRRECCADLERRVRLPQAELADRMLNWEQVRTMCRNGIAFGAHTMTHPVVSRLTTEDLEIELRESREVLEAGLGMPVLDFAFPFGSAADCGSEAQPHLTRLGYRSAVTTVTGINSPGANPFALRRMQIGEEHSPAMFALRISQAFLFPGPIEAASLVSNPSLGANDEKSPQPTETL